MKIKTSRRDYIWSFLAYVLKFGINLFVFPLVLTQISSEEYGLWVTFTSVGTIVNLFDFGFSSTLLRNITYVWGGAKTLQKEGFETVEDSDTCDERMFSLTIKTCRKIYLVISLLALFFMSTVGLVYILFIIRDIFSWKYVVAWLVYSISIFLNLYYSYWSVSLKAVGGIEQSQKATIIGFTLQLLISYVGLLCGTGIISLALANCVSGFAIRLFSKRFLMSFENIGVILRNKYEIAKQEYSQTFKTLWFNAKKAGVSSIATVAMSQSTTLICSGFYGVGITAQLGICLQLAQFILGIGQIFYQTSIPQLTQLKLSNNISEAKKVFSVSLLWGWLVVIGGTIGVLLVGNPLLKLIDSQTYIEPLIFLIVSVITFGELNYSMHSSLISLENTLPFVPSVIATSIISIICCLLCAIFELDIVVLLLVRLLVETAYIFWKWPYVAEKQLKTNPWQLIKCGTIESFRAIKKVFGNK